MENIKMELEAAIALAEKNLSPESKIYNGFKSALHLISKFYNYMEAQPQIQAATPVEPVEPAEVAVEAPVVAPSEPNA